MKILALGADIKNKFLFAKDGKFFFGPDIGDLSDADNYERFRREVRKAIKGGKPEAVVCDLHPGYFSTRFADEFTDFPTPDRKTAIFRSGVGKWQVQHHHAHIASVMCEHGLKGPVIGVAFDGTGYGLDGNIWGGEFLLVKGKSFERLAHLKYYMMPGGDKTALEPWRMAVSYLGEKAFPYIKGINIKDKKLVLDMMKKNINSPRTSSAGRLFDAASAILGLCERAKYEAEGPIMMEAAAEKGIEGSYGFNIAKEKGALIIDAKKILSHMISDMKKGVKRGIISAKFHNSVAGMIIKTVKMLSKRTGIKVIALSGGVFANKYLSKRAIAGLKAAGLNVFVNEKYPVTDLNIAIGQYYVIANSKS